MLSVVGMGGSPAADEPKMGERTRTQGCNRGYV